MTECQTCYKMTNSISTCEHCGAILKKGGKVKVEYKKITQADYKKHQDQLKKHYPDMSISDWLVVFLLMNIPVVSVIYFFNSISKNAENKTLKNYFLALVIAQVIIVLFALFFYNTFGAWLIR